MQSVSDNFVHGSAALSNYLESEGILGPDGLRISHVSYVKNYINKTIRGVGEVQLQYRYEMSGSIDFVGFELFSGAYGNRKGSVVFDLSGSVNSNTGVVSVQQVLKSSSGSAEFLGCSGKGSYVISKDGYCSFEFALQAL